RCSPVRIARSTHSSVDLIVLAEIIDCAASIEQFIIPRHHIAEMDARRTRFGCDQRVICALLPLASVAGNRENGGQE
ncbi:hypothetical protein PENTCL1PPCAC_18077, partial [Pristionchus entomophagus]